jgi:hypothetical protein
MVHIPNALEVLLPLQQQVILHSLRHIAPVRQTKAPFPPLEQCLPVGWCVAMLQGWALRFNATWRLHNSIPHLHFGWSVLPC